MAKVAFLYWIGRKFARFGTGSYINPFGQYSYPEKIFIGDHVYIGPRAFVSASEGIFIGNGVIIGPEFMVMGGDHNFRVVGQYVSQTKSGGINEKVIIEDDVWIGARVLILKGVTIGEGAIVGAGSVVTKDIMPYTVVAGNPARKINNRFKPGQLCKHLKLINSKYDFNQLGPQIYRDEI